MEGRDYTGPPKLFRREVGASKLFPTQEMGHKILIKNSPKFFQENVNFQSLLSVTLI